MNISGLSIAHPSSTLFTVRLWREMLDTEPGALCMQVKHVLSGETRYFRDWSQVAAYLEDKVQATKQDEPPYGQNPSESSGS